MRIGKFLTLIVGLVLTVGVAQAGVSIDDRFFEVKVKLIAGGQSPFFDDAGGPPVSNCYSFLGDNTWIDPNFTLDPIGTWVSEDPKGVVERYTAMADSDEIPGVLPALLLVQEGQITPAGGNGKVRLQAFSTLFVDGTDIVLAMFMSTGHEVDGCPPP